MMHPKVNQANDNSGKQCVRVFWLWISDEINEFILVK